MPRYEVLRLIVGDRLRKARMIELPGKGRQ